MNSKKWLILFFSIILIAMIFVAITIVIIDPYFHYHKPLSFFGYRIDNERYQNNGIVKNFDYNAIITGTSHTENFKTSEFDKLFSCNSIKVPLSGAQPKELSEQIQVGMEHNPNLKIVLYGVTYEDFYQNKDATKYDEYPTYLYDDNILNDYKYIFSGQAMRKIATSLLKNWRHTTTFDEYCNWNDKFTFSKETTIKKIIDDRKQDRELIKGLTDDERKMVEDNIEQNYVELAKKNENINYYMFVTPSSILWWDEAIHEGTIQKHLEAEEIFYSKILECKNVKVYSYFNNYDLICNLDNYKDKTHYSEKINSQILNWIKNDEYLITKKNVNEYMQKEREFYLNYDYDAIFE